MPLGRVDAGASTSRLVVMVSNFGSNIVFRSDRSVSTKEGTESRSRLFLFQPQHRTKMNRTAAMITRPRRSSQLLLRSLRGKDTHLQRQLPRLQVGKVDCSGRRCCYLDPRHHLLEPGRLVRRVHSSPVVTWTIGADSMSEPRPKS